MLWSDLAFPGLELYPWTQFSPKHEQSLLPTCLSFGGRERKDGLSFNNLGMKGGTCFKLVISPLFPKFVFHTHWLCSAAHLSACRDDNSRSPASPLIQGLSASVCLTGQISSLSIKKLFLAPTCFWWCGRFIFNLGKSVAMFWIPKWLTDW